MKKFAIVKDEIVINVVVSEDNDAVAILSAMFPGHLVADITDLDPTTGIGCKKIGNRFQPIPPHSDWTFNDESFKWEPPIPMPDLEENQVAYWENGQWEVVQDLQQDEK